MPMPADECRCPCQRHSALRPDRRFGKGSPFACPVSRSAPGAAKHGRAGDFMREVHCPTDRRGFNSDPIGPPGVTNSFAFEMMRGEGTRRSFMRVTCNFAAATAQDHSSRTRSQVWHRAHPGTVCPGTCPCLEASEALEGCPGTPPQRGAFIWKDNSV